MLISDIVRRNAEHFPDRDATVVPDVETRTWAQLEERSNRLANALLDLGIRKGDRVATLASNAPEYLEFFFACAKTGIIGSTCNVRLAPYELESYLRYTEPSAIIVSADQADLANRFIGEVPSIGHVIGFGSDHGLPLDYEDISAAASAGTPAATVDDSDIYQLASTSGTTGIPKGAILSHRNAIAAMLNWVAEMPIRENDTNLQCIPMFFNPGGPAQIHPVMLKAGRSVILPGFDPGQFLRMVPRYRVTHSTAVPTMLGMILDHPECGSHDVSSIRGIITGGSPVPRTLTTRVREVFGNVLFPTFGMAETYSCGMVLRPESQHVEGTEAEVRRLGSAGKPHVLIRVRVVGDDGQDVPADDATAGELWVKGDTVSPGYFRMDDETANSRRDGWFLTGDVATMDEDGFVTIVDRKKDMIITGGINVFCTDVEGALYAHPAVAQCAVIGIPHPQWGEAIHACVVLRPGQTVTSEELMRFAGERLAAYKKPRSLDLVDTLPLSGTGKILKRELRKRYWPET